MKSLKSLMETIAPWLPFAFALYLCQSTLSYIVASDMKFWEPGFYSFLPMCFFFVGAVTHLMTREIRELRREVAQLQANGRAGVVAA